MSVFYVFQGETYKEERKGGYVWSPQLAKGGRKNVGYTNMTYICRGDYIVHNSNGYILSISRALGDCYSSAQPDELVQANTTVN